MNNFRPEPALQQQHFHSNGKLMISGEYMVLSGATALAMPVRFGQSLQVTAEPASDAMITWTALEKEELWFTTSLLIDPASPARIIAADDNPLAKKLADILTVAKALQPSFLLGNMHWNVTTRLEFNRHWGLGSSSTLISNIAYWAKTDPYALLFPTMGGSGYDIACARSQTALLYQYRGTEQQAVVAQTRFHPPFAGQLFFVYSGRKQSSADSLAGFDPSAVDKEMTGAITSISLALTQTGSLKVFQQLLEEHEAIVGRAIGKQPVQQASFPDFPGVVKSLGAWGGDFLLAASDMEPGRVASYFKSRGYHVIIPFHEISMCTNVNTQDDVHTCDSI